jgi:hypothetical protein
MTGKLEFKEAENQPLGLVYSNAIVDRRDEFVSRSTEGSNS